MITKKEIHDRIEILEDGQVQLRKATIIEEDGVEISRQFHREVRTPDDDVSDLPARVKNITEANFQDPETQQRWKKKKAPEWSSFESHEFQQMELGTMVKDQGKVYELTDAGQGHRQPSGADGHHGWSEL